MTAIVDGALLVAGLLLIAFGLLSYEPEEQAGKRALEGLWIHLDDVEASGTQRIRGLLTETAKYWTLIFNAFYGPRLLSLRAFVVSLGLSITPLAMVSSILGGPHRYVALLFAASALALPFTYHQKTSRKMSALFGALVAGLAWILLLLFIEGGLIAYFDKQKAVTVIGIIVFLDLIALLTGRAAMRRAIHVTPTLAKAALISLPCFLVALIFVFLPNQISNDASGLAVFSIRTLMFFPATTAFLIFIYTAALVTAQALLSLLPRSIYSAIKFKLVDNRKFCLTAGAILLGIPFVSTSSLIEKIAKAITG